MRKLLALAMVALLAGFIALAAVSCGQKAEDTSSTTTTPLPAETAPMDSMMSDTTGMMPADTTAH